MLYLHIGFNKTGSSTVQSFLRQNAGALADRGVLYPTTGLDRRAAHHHIAEALLNSTPLPEFAEIRAAAERGTVVLSSERFNLCDPAEVRAALGPARVICYRRDFMADPISRYVQHAKPGRNARSFDEEFARKAIIFVPARALAPWTASFDSVRLRSLTPACLEGGDLITDVCAAIGLASREGLEPCVDRNVSPGWMPVEVVRAFTLGLLEGGAPADKVSDFVSRSLRKAAEEAAIRCGLNARGLYLSADQIAMQLERDRDDRARLAASGADVLTAPPVPPPPRAFMPEAARIPPRGLATLLDAIRDRLLARPRLRRRA